MCTHIKHQKTERGCGGCEDREREIGGKVDERARAIERQRDKNERGGGGGLGEGLVGMGGVRGGSLRAQEREHVRACVSVFGGWGGAEHTDQEWQGQR